MSTERDEETPVTDFHVTAQNFNSGIAGKEEYQNFENHNKQKMEYNETTTGNFGGSSSGTVGLVMKSKPAREIYKPPSLRRSRSGHGYQGRYQGHQGLNPNFGTKNTSGSQEQQDEGMMMMSSSSNESLRSDQSTNNGFNITSQNQNGGNSSKAPGHGRPLNVNAKEFQSRNKNGQPRSSYWNGYDQGHGRYILYQKQFYQDHAHTCGMMNVGRGQGQPLVHSKSSNSMLSQFQKYFDQQQSQPQQGTEQPKGLQQSKSSGNIGMRSRVRFFGDNQSVISEVPSGDEVEAMETNPEIEKQLAALKLEANEGAEGKPLTSCGNNNGQTMKTESVKSLQKLLFQKNPFEMNEQHFGESTKQQPSWERIKSHGTDFDWSRPNAPIKRSKSFGCPGRNYQNTTTTTTINRSIPVQCNWNDFEMKKWPKGVIESVTTAINGVERVPARHKIDMVTRIFGTMLGDYDQNVLTQDNADWTRPTVNNGLTDFIRPAVYIFLYFIIQKDKDQTVMESLLNNCLATYQSLFQGSIINQSTTTPKKSTGTGPLLLISFSTTTKWIIFLNFLSSFYQKVKTFCLSNHQSGKGQLEDFSKKFLSLICDSCSVVLRLSPVSYTTELMDSLFTVMTSLGRDMETTFPLKMKQILAAVRDVLLGIKSSEQPLSPHVHKTLMQLIELHAANWQLPASAVRYYYSSIPFNQHQSKDFPKESN